MRSSWGARIFTLNTVDAANYGEIVSSGDSSSNQKSSSPSSSFQIQSIPNLPSSEHAMSLLRRIQSEFTLIAQKRGYNILSVTEMCCCADGLDHLPGRKKGRKTRIMPNNVLGYNFTTQTTNHFVGNRKATHRIHLRLRHTQSHRFYCYDEIAGVMCHELAHCEVGPHNAQFYKVMDEIMEQHAVFMVRGVVTDQSGFPINSDDAHVLGGETNGNRGNNDRAFREKIAQERLHKQRNLGLGGSFRLGGGFMPDNYNNASTLAHLPPNEAAKRAAERRIEERIRNDSKYCLPCQEVIDLLDASSDEEEEIETKKKETKGAHSDDVLGRVTSRNHPEQETDIVILDDCDDFNDEHLLPKKKQLRRAKSQQSLVGTQDGSSDVECTCWICAKCTYHNEAKHLSCEICGHDQNRKRHKKNVMNHLQEIQKEELKAQEVENSMRDFGGFNIYGNTKRSSRTLNHMT